MPHRVVPWRALTCIVCLSIATFYSTSGLIAMRSAIYGVPRGAAILHHGIGHNMYIGLGVKGNPWGIEWSDEHAYEAAKKVSSVEYASEGHFRNLWRLYFQTILSEPVEVLKIYIGKLGQSLGVAAGRNMPWAMLAVVVLLACLHKYIEKAWIWPAMAIWAGFGMVVLQGVLAMPLSDFISPGRIACLCGIAVLGDIAARAVRRRLMREHIPA